MAPSPGETRAALLAAAERLFSQRGYAAVGIREIVQAAGANLAAVKYHFGSKRELYLATVRRVVEQRPTADAWDSIASPPRDRAAAARLLVAFVRALLPQLAVPREANPCSQLMLHEALRPSEALDDVVRCHTAPHEARLLALLRAAAPGADEPRLVRTARGLLGQVLYYVVFRAFLERQEGARLFRPKALREVADHVARSALLTAGCSPSFVDGALAAPASPRRSPSR